MKISFCLFFISLFVSGCSSTVELSSAVDANREIGEGAATVSLKSGQEYEGREVRVSTDSTRFVDRNAKDILQFPNQDIRSIRVAHHGGGAVEGLLFGGLGGGALGLALGIGMDTSGDEGMGKGLLLITCMAVGSVGGLTFGAIKGHDYTFVFPNDSIMVGAGTSSTTTDKSGQQIDTSAP
jgi:hypothetical protein